MTLSSWNSPVKATTSIRPSTTPNPASNFHAIFIVSPVDNHSIRIRQRASDSPLALPAAATGSGPDHPQPEQKRYQGTQQTHKPLNRQALKDFKAGPFETDGCDNRYARTAAGMQTIENIVQLMRIAPG
jgi:hypothetical protein